MPQEDGERGGEASRYRRVAIKGWQKMAVEWGGGGGEARTGCVVVDVVVVVGQFSSKKILILISCKWPHCWGKYERTFVRDGERGLRRTKEKDLETLVEGGISKKRDKTMKRNLNYASAKWRSYAKRSLSRKGCREGKKISQGLNNEKLKK